MDELVIKENAKSVIVGRKKVDDDIYYSIITLFDINDPHLSTEMPKKTFEFECNSVNFVNPLKFKFLTQGNDIVINNISEITIKENKEEKEVVVNIE